VGAGWGPIANDLPSIDSILHYIAADFKNLGFSNLAAGGCENPAFVYGAAFWAMPEIRPRERSCLDGELPIKNAY
jgi:hypothetical protein